MANGPTFRLSTGHTQSGLGYSSPGRPRENGRFVKQSPEVSESDTRTDAAVDDLPAEVPHPAPTDAAGRLAAALLDLTTTGASQSKDLAEIRKTVADLATSTGNDLGKLRAGLGALSGTVADLINATPKTVQFQLGTGPAGPVVKGARPELGEIIRRIAAGRVNVWMSGPAGSGKTTLAEQIATALGRRFGAQSFGPDITTGALIGGVDVTGHWKEPSFVDFYENGGVYLLDEIDAADPAILLILNAALENGKLFIPRHHDPERRIIRRHADTVILCAANTWGTGADAQYVGRTQLDAAFLSRFALAKFFVGYDTTLEASLCPDQPLLSQLHTIRGRIIEHKIRRLCGTREIKAAGQLRAAGFAQSDIIAALMVDWTESEKAKCL
jgi:hypothetical protein